MTKPHTDSLIRFLLYKEAYISPAWMAASIELSNHGLHAVQ